MNSVFKMLYFVFKNDDLNSNIKASCRGKTAEDIADCLAVLLIENDRLPAATDAASEIATDRPTDRPTDRSTDGPTDRSADGSTDLVVTTLIPPAVPHAGAGSMYIDGGFSVDFLADLDALYERLTVVGSDRTNTCAVRSYHCDCTGEIGDVIVPVVLEALRQQKEPTRGSRDGPADDESITTSSSSSGGGSSSCVVLPRCRFLCYREAGGDMQPHIDLSKALDEYGAHNITVILLHSVERKCTNAARGRLLVRNAFSGQIACRE